MASKIVIFFSFFIETFSAFFFFKVSDGKENNGLIQVTAIFPTLFQFNLRWV